MQATRAQWKRRGGRAQTRIRFGIARVFLLFILGVAGFARGQQFIPGLVDSLSLRALRELSGTMPVSTSCASELFRTTLETDPMKIAASLVFAATAIVLATPASAQFAKPEDAVKYRQSVMTVM